MGELAKRLRKQDPKGFNDWTDDDLEVSFLKEHGHEDPAYKQLADTRNRIYAQNLAVERADRGVAAAAALPPSIEKNFVERAADASAPYLEPISVPGTGLGMMADLLQTGGKNIRIPAAGEELRGVTGALTGGASLEKTLPTQVVDSFRRRLALSTTPYQPDPSKSNVENLLAGIGHGVGATTGIGLGGLGLGTGETPGEEKHIRESFEKTNPIYATAEAAAEPPAEMMAAMIVDPAMSGLHGLGTLRSAGQTAQTVLRSGAALKPVQAARLIAAANKGKIASAAGGALGASFIPGMSAGGGTGIGAGRAALDSGDPIEAARNLSQGAMDLGFAGGAGTHLYQGLKPRPPAPPQAAPEGQEPPKNMLERMREEASKKIAESRTQSDPLPETHKPAATQGRDGEFQKVIGPISINANKDVKLAGIPVPGPKSMLAEAAAVAAVAATGAMVGGPLGALATGVPGFIFRKQFRQLAAKGGDPIGRAMLERAGFGAGEARSESKPAATVGTRDLALEGTSDTLTLGSPTVDQTGVPNAMAARALPVPEVLRPPAPSLTAAPPEATRPPIIPQVTEPVVQPRGMSSSMPPMSIEAPVGAAPVAPAVDPVIVALLKTQYPRGRGTPVAEWEASINEMASRITDNATGAKAGPPPAPAPPAPRTPEQVAETARMVAEANARMRPQDPPPAAPPPEPPPTVAPKAPVEPRPTIEQRFAEEVANAPDLLSRLMEPPPKAPESGTSVEKKFGEVVPAERERLRPKSAEEQLTAQRAAGPLTIEQMVAEAIKAEVKAKEHSDALKEGTHPKNKSGLSTKELEESKAFTDTMEQFREAKLRDSRDNLVTSEKTARAIAFSMADKAAVTAAEAAKREAGPSLETQLRASVETSPPIKAALETAGVKTENPPQARQSEAIPPVRQRQVIVTSEGKRKGQLGTVVAQRQGRPSENAGRGRRPNDYEVKFEDGTTDWFNAKGVRDALAKDRGKAPKAASGRVDIKAILANPEQRRELMVPTIQAIQAREGIKTTRAQAEAAYDKVQAEKAEKPAQKAVAAPETTRPEVKPPEVEKQPEKAPAGARTPETMGQIKALLDAGDYEKAANLARETTDTPADRTTRDGKKVGFVDSTGAMITAIDEDGFVSKIKPTPRQSNEVQQRVGAGKQYSPPEKEDIITGALPKGWRATEHGTGDRFSIRGPKKQVLNGRMEGDTVVIDMANAGDATGYDLTGIGHAVKGTGREVIFSGVEGMTQEGATWMENLERKGIVERTGKAPKWRLVDKPKYSIPETVEEKFDKQGVRGPKTADKELLKMVTSGQKKDVGPELDYSGPGQEKRTPPHPNTKRPFADGWLDIEDVKKSQPKGKGERQFSVEPDELGFYSQAEKVVADAKAPKRQTGEAWGSFLKNPQRGVTKEEMFWTGLDDYLKEHADRPITKEEIAAYLKQNKVEIIEVGNPNTTKSGPRQSTRHRDYTEEGDKSNYREIRLTVPKTREGENTFVNTNHYNEPGVVVSFRVNDRTTLFQTGEPTEAKIQEWVDKGYLNSKPGTPAYEKQLEALKNIQSKNGRGKTLFVEEVQSDAGSKAKEGFAPTKGQQDRVDIAVSKLSGFVEDMREKYGLAEGIKKENWSGSERAKHQSLVEERLAAMQAVAPGVNGPPPAPFIAETKKYTDLAVKRLLRIAAEEGYDSVAWTTGDIQSRRWSLKVGSKWAYDYYDKMIPGSFERVGKKFGVKVVESTNEFIPKSEVVKEGQEWKQENREVGPVKLQSVVLTPEMRERIMEEGFPQYKEKGAGKEAPLGKKMTPKDMQKWLPENMRDKVYRDAETGDLVVDAKGGTIIFRPEDNIPIDFGAMSKGYSPEVVARVKASGKGAAGEKSTVGGKALIKIHDQGELPHEIEHVYWDHFSTGKERTTLIKKFSEAAKKNNRTTVEQIAVEYKKFHDRMLENPEWQPKGMAGKFIKRIYDFFEGAYRDWKPTDKSIFKKVHKGEVFERAPRTDTGMVAPKGNWPVDKTGRGARPGTQYIVTPEQARGIDMKTTMPSSPEFAEAVKNTPGASLSKDGLSLKLLRFQKPEQAGEQSVRTGVFYLPSDKASQAKAYRTTPAMERSLGGSRYGGTEKIAGETVVRHPLVVGGGTGGKVPEAAFERVAGKGAVKKLWDDTLEISDSYAFSRKKTPDLAKLESEMSELMGKSNRLGFPENKKFDQERRQLQAAIDYELQGMKRTAVGDLLKKYGADPGLANEIIYNSKSGNQLGYALRENIIAHAVREAGYDSVLGHYGGKFTELFDVREQAYPVQGEEAMLHPAFEEAFPKKGVVETQKTDLTPRLGKVDPLAKADKSAAPVETEHSVATKGAIAPKSYSVSTVEETMSDIREYNKKHEVFPQEAVDRYEAALKSVAAKVHGDFDRLGYEAIKGMSALKGNADKRYGKSLDFTTLCRRRYVLSDTVDAIQRAFSDRTGKVKILEAEDIIKIRSRLEEQGHEVNCGPCYVESRRIYISGAVNKAKDGFVDNRVGKTFGKTIRIDPKYHDLLVDQAGRDKLFAEHPDQYAILSKAFSGARMKIPVGRAAYAGEILRLTKGQVDKFNKYSGLRSQSWSDFEVPHLLDKMQAVYDMTARKLKGHSYTKEIGYVETMKQTGEAINMSLIPDGTGFDKNGKLSFNEKESIRDMKRAREIRREHDNVGFEAIGISDKHIKALLADPGIDYVIPYHASGLNLEYQHVGKMKGWDDYTSSAHWRDAKTGEAVEVDREIFVDEWKGDLKKLDALAKKNGVVPPFHQFRNMKGYEKLLVDRRIWDANGKFIEQKPVEFKFDMNKVHKMLDEYQGDHGKRTAVQSVVDEFAPKDMLSQMKEAATKKLTPLSSNEAIKAKQQEWLNRPPAKPFSEAKKSPMAKARDTFDVGSQYNRRRGLEKK